MSYLRNPPAVDWVDRIETTIYRHIKYTSSTFLLTKPIYTFCDAPLTKYDVHRYIELGLTVIRFTMRNLPLAEIRRINEIIKRALRFFCNKYHVPSWPIALAADLLNATIRTGQIDPAIKDMTVTLNPGDIVTVTSDAHFAKLCSENLIYIDDALTLANVKPGTEISLIFERIVLVVTQVIDKQNMKCEVIYGGVMSSCQIINIRNVKHVKQKAHSRDSLILKIAAEYEFEVIIINTCLDAATIYELRDGFKQDPPLLIASISELEGAENAVEIVEACDAIIIAHDFLYNELENRFKTFVIQNYFIGLCKKNKKPVFITGSILEEVLSKGGKMTSADMAVITDILYHGASLLVRCFKDTQYLNNAMTTVADFCKTIEPLHSTDIWRLYEEHKMPVNAADACIISCSLMAIMRSASLIIVLTATGSTVTQLFNLVPNICIIAVVTKLKVAKQLQIYRGVNAYVHLKNPSHTWEEDMNARISEGIAYGLRFEFMTYGDTCVILKKTSPASPFCDHVSTVDVQLQEVDVMDKQMCI